jgi:ADP-L-glycero-D-manno-heptose 6-epimerase
VPQGSIVLVTGAAGFVGARVVQALNQAGRPAVSVDGLDKFDSRPEHAGIDYGTRVSPDHIRTWLRDHGHALHSIIHMGACTDTRETDRAYLGRVNVAASQDLWRAAIDLGIPFIYASSAATYGDGALGYDDDETRLPRLKPLNPYGESKQQFDLWALAEERAGRTPPAWAGLKFFNVYGFGERHKGLMSSVVIQAFDQIRATGRVRLFKSHKPGVADGHQARDFVFIDDVVGVILGMIERPPVRGIFNLGSGTARTFLDLARATFVAMGRPEQIDFVETPKDLRATYQYFTEAPMAKLRAAGFALSPISLEDGVRQYVRALDQAAAAVPARV